MCLTYASLDVVLRCSKLIYGHLFQCLSFHTYAEDAVDGQKIRHDCI